MATFREAIYMVMDYLKIHSDDAYYTEDHIKFLLTKFRAYVLKSKYEDNTKTVADQPSDSNYQTVELDLEQVDGVDGVACTGTYMRSVQKIPSKLNIGLCRIWAGTLFGDNLILVTPTRFRYAGTGRIASMFNYATIGQDMHLYFKSDNPQLYYLEKANIRAVFEDPEKAYELEDEMISANGGTPECNILDRNFPLEDNLLALCMQYVVKELTGSVYKPSDNANNAADDLSELANFIRNYTKQPLRTQVTGS